MFRCLMQGWLAFILHNLFSEEIIQDVCFVRYLSVDMYILIQRSYDISLIMFDKVQGPSWPRILGRSDFSLQEN